MTRRRVGVASLSHDEDNRGTGDCSLVPIRLCGYMRKPHHECDQINLMVRWGCMSQQISAAKCAARPSFWQTDQSETSGCVRPTILSISTNIVGCSAVQCTILFDTQLHHRTYISSHLLAVVESAEFEQAQTLHHRPDGALLWSPKLLCPPLL